MKAYQLTERPQRCTVLSLGAAAEPLLGAVRVSRFTPSCRWCYRVCTIAWARSTILKRPAASGYAPLLVATHDTWGSERSWLRAAARSPKSECVVGRTRPMLHDPLVDGRGAMRFAMARGPSAFVFVEAWWQALPFQYAHASHAPATILERASSKAWFNAMHARKNLCPPTLLPSIVHIRTTLGRCFGTLRLMACVAGACNSLGHGNVLCSVGHGSVAYASTRSCLATPRSRCLTSSCSAHATRSRTPSAANAAPALVPLCCSA